MSGTFLACSAAKTNEVRNKRSSRNVTQCTKLAKPAAPYDLQSVRMGANEHAPSTRHLRSPRAPQTMGAAAATMARKYKAQQGGNGKSGSANLF